MSSKDATIQKTLENFRGVFGIDADLHVGWSPGRVNLIGEHTDYNKGFVLPMAIDLGICAVLRVRARPGISIYADIDKKRVDVSLSTAEYTEMPLWARYIAGVAVLSIEHGAEFSGFDIAVNGNLPVGGGVSSSAALCTATAMAIQSAIDWSCSPLETAQLCQAVEHRFAGVQCGIMDQMACRMGRHHSALFVDCASLESMSVAIAPRRVEFLIVDSGVSRTLYNSDYNLRAMECRQAVEALQRIGVEIRSLRDVTIEVLDLAASELPKHLERRARHVVTENDRVTAARRALETQQFVTFGRLMNASHQSLRDHFEVSVDELDHIVAVANELEGALGARLTGAGFGGNAIVLCKNGSADAVTTAIRNAFETRFQRVPSIHHIKTTNEAEGYHLEPIVRSSAG